jgi:hypothetical protein
MGRYRHGHRPELEWMAGITGRIRRNVQVTEEEPRGRIMDGFSGGQKASTSWSIDDIPFQDLDHDAVRDDRQLFYSLAAGSFIEITSDLYTANLVAFYQGDDEVTGWLSEQWEPEELQHGAVLRRYVETAWPDFDWDAVYRGFLAEYSGHCGVADNQALELAARCVVETGTATAYRALSEMTAEPVLKRIAANISTDEVRHYKYFYRFFQRYRERERTGRFAVARTLWQRVNEVDVEDAFLAFKHVWLASNPGGEFRHRDYAEFRAHVWRSAGHHYPYNMAVRMLLKPLELNPTVVRGIVPPIVFATRLLV